MHWTKQRILEELRSLAKKRVPLGYTALARRNQSLVSAAAYHFGSYRAAVVKAGIDYAEQLQRPHWTKQRVIAVIKQARRKNHDLHWGAVSRRGDELGRAAHAAVQKRLFGSWPRALQASGIDADEVAIYRRWDKTSIASELKARAADDEPLSSGDLQKEDPGLHAAALRYFGSYAAALKAAGLSPDRYRKRRVWTKQDVTREIRARARKKLPMTDGGVRRDDARLYGAATRLFGSYTAARNATGIKSSKR
jgi:hypothetical protein